MATTQVLLDAAARWPDRTLFRVDGTQVTFATFAEDCLRLAAGFQVHGVRQGDRVAVLMDNSLACLQTWFAANLVGATWAPINTAFRGEGLRHAVTLTAPRLLVVDRDLLPALPSDDDRAFEVVVHATRASAEPRHLALASLFDHGRLSTPYVADPDELAVLLFTSGTTGRSKACMLSHGYLHTAGTIFAREMGVTAEDVLYCPFPLFHLDATALTTMPALLTGACAAIGRRFSASRFWDEVRDVGATVIEFMGATLTILQKQPPRHDDADNPVRVAWGVPATELAPAFEQRFGLRVVVPYGSTEANLCAVQRPTRDYPPGSCGQAVPELQIAIADGTGSTGEPAGRHGEIVVRATAPNAMFSGYFGMPEATAAAVRDGWFHTGDIGHLDDAGNLYFVGRDKDVIRRRGENISAFEVEEVIQSHPAVKLCAVIGVPSELSEEDVKAVVVVHPDRPITESQLADHCAARLARFQVPRYVELVDDLPRTPTGKLQKHPLRREPLNRHTWDRDTRRYVQPPTT